MAGDAARTLSPLVLAGPRLAGQEDLLGPAALEFLVELHRTFEARRQERLAARRQRQARFDAGELPDFREDTRAIQALNRALKDDTRVDLSLLPLGDGLTLCRKR